MTKQQILQQSIINAQVIKAMTPRHLRTPEMDQLLESLQDWFEEIKEPELTGEKCGWCGEDFALHIEESGFMLCPI